MIMEVFPLHSTNQLRDSLLRYAISLAYLALRWTIRLLPNKQYLAGLRFSDLAINMRLSARTPISALGYAIKDIVQILPKPKMRRVAAWRIIASMEHINPVWDGTLSKGPSQSMSFPKPFAVPRRAISATIFGLLPWPAGIGPARLVYLRPELLNGRHSKVCVAVVAQAAIMFIAQAQSLVLFSAPTDSANSHGDEFTSSDSKGQR